MSQSIVPVKIRKHLIPFFYKEFKGEEARYLNKTVKACKITMNSSLGKMIRRSLEQIDYPEHIEKFNMFISIYDQESSNKKTNASLYKCVSGKHSFLKVPEEVEKDLNEILEDQFRITFIASVKSAVKYNQNIKVKDAIADFMLEYGLDEYGYRLESLRTLYNREVKKKALLSRMQIKVSNRVLNY